MKFLNPKGTIPVSIVSSWVYADAEKSRQIGQAMRKEVEKSGKKVVVVACSLELQMQRLMKRMSLDRGKAEAMIASQMPLAEKIRRADHVVWNNGPREVLVAQAQLLAGFWQNSK